MRCFRQARPPKGHRRDLSGDDLLVLTRKSQFDWLKVTLQWRGECRDRVEGGWAGEGSGATVVR